MAKVIIVGSGPAGVSAALYTARAGLDTTVFTMGSGALQKAEKIQNYYGFAKPLAGAELEREGIEGAKNVGVKFEQHQVVGLTFAESLVVETAEGNFAADFVVLATGVSRNAPKLPGLRELEGRGVSYCAVCDAFFYRGKNVAVLGSGEFAAHEMAALLPIAAKVTLLTNGEPLTAQFPPEVQVLSGKLSAITGNERVESVQFADGSALETDGVFVALGVAGSTALAKKIGAAVEANRILVDETMATNVPGLYAAGDCTGGLLQVAKAVYQGAQAGSEIAKLARKKV